MQRSGVPNFTAEENYSSPATLKRFASEFPHALMWMWKQRSCAVPRSTLFWCIRRERAELVGRGTGSFRDSILGKRPIKCPDCLAFGLGATQKVSTHSEDW
jgi:hypothetical protein